MTAPVPVLADVAHLLPKVHSLKVNDGYVSTNSLRIIDPQETPALSLYLADCGASISDDGAVQVTVEYVDSIPGAFRHEFADWPDEEYSLSVTPREIAVKAVTKAGVARAAQTIAQLAIGRDATLPCVEITDWPAFKVRGFMHDVGRSFIEPETLKRHIDLLSRFKINTFHWHLTENQAWRFEVRGYPQLTSAESMTRLPGMYYTQRQCADLARYAADRGVTIIPEIDMPGHSDAFTRAMGFPMQTDEGIAVLKEALRQLAETFPDAPYIHIGADEVALVYPDFLQIMTSYVQNDLHRKVIVWNPISRFTITDKSGFDMTTTWHSTGKAVAGMPNIDTRYNYTNLMDVFADPVGLFRSTVYHEPRGTKDIVGTIAATWNDRRMATEQDIVNQNNFFAVALANAERAWVGDRNTYFEEGGAMLPADGEEHDAFADWENRFLLHKEGLLRNEPIPYVCQSNVRWRVTAPMRQGVDTQPRDTVDAAGAAVYLRHSWGNRVRSLFSCSPADTLLSYAYTYVYSPVEQTVGALIEFQTYGRSEIYPAPPAGQWDCKGSDVWVNGERVSPPEWIGSTVPGTIDREDLLGNQNLSARRPSEVTLRKGWNKVVLKLPYCPVPGIRLNQWMFTFVLTDLDGRRALTDIIYSPDK